ncbi:radical SAM protein [Pelomyxa schiedti]|nr:radical SAM protein [Pelomyxa schiedti]
MSTSYQEWLQRDRGSLEARVAEAYRIWDSCVMCGRRCGVNRLNGSMGYCKAPRNAFLCSWNPHYGEEPPLVGRYGSGTIFFSSCNLLCVFCQNDDISHGREGKEYTPAQLADIMLSLQNQRRCHNINLVTPSHQLPPILEAIVIAAKAGLDIPIVWNCGGYESMEAMHLLDGIVDIYMPDFKFWESDPARRFMNTPDYREVACTAIKEMHRQVGVLKLDFSGIAKRGLLIRRLQAFGHAQWSCGDKTACPVDCS